MRCSDIMRAEFVALAPEDTVRKAARKLAEQDVSALPVVGEGGYYLGMVTERTLVRKVIMEGLDPDVTLVSLIADQQVPSCDPEDPVAVAVKRMDEGAWRWLPVVQEGRLVGEVGAREIARAVGTEETHGLHAVTEREIVH